MHKNKKDHVVVFHQDSQISGFSVKDQSVSDSSNLLSIANCNLDYFSSRLFASILEDTIMELTILGTANNELSLVKAQCDYNKLLAVKFRVPQPPPQFVEVLSTVHPKDFAKEEYKVQKLIDDRMFIKRTMLDTYRDLCEHLTFCELVAVIKTIIQTDTYRDNLDADHAKNTIFDRELGKEMRCQMNHFKATRYENDSLIENLKGQINDAQLISETKSRYISKWQTAQEEQHVTKIYRKEKPVFGTIEYYKTKVECEHRVHCDLEILTNLQINELLEQVSAMMEKFDKDTEAMDLKIQIAKNNCDVEDDRRKDLEEIIEKHDKLIKDWVQFKDEREKANQYRKKMMDAAIVIQAWWRGFMCRNQLGPYKPTKKPPKQKKK